MSIRIYTIFTQIQGNSSFLQFIISKMWDCQIMAHKVKNVTYKNSPENGDRKGRHTLPAESSYIRVNTLYVFRNYTFTNYFSVCGYVFMMIKIKFWCWFDTMKSHRWFTIVSKEAPTSNLSTLKNEAAGSAEMLVTTVHNKVS